MQKVELIGGEGWLEHISVAIAAVFAAALAALVAILNRRAQLKHDREMRNRDHVRDTIDEAVALASEAVKAASLFSTKLKHAESARERLASSAADPKTPLGSDAEVTRYETDLQTGASALYAALVNLHPASVRLVMRLGEHHAICTTFETTKGAIEAIYMQGVSGLEGNRGVDEQKEDQTRIEELRDFFSAFRNACYDWFNR